MSEEKTISKLMALTEKQFLHTLPRALASDAYEWDGRTVTLAEGAKTLTITFNAQDTFKLGGFSVPRAEVTLTFEGYSDADAEAALARFDRYFHRGGG